jgi:hypothetical protein
LKFAIAGLEAEGVRIEHLPDELREQVGGTSSRARVVSQSKVQPRTGCKDPEIAPRFTIPETKKPAEF